jgi:hypothetical protein
MIDHMKKGFASITQPSRLLQTLVTPQVSLITKMACVTAIFVSMPVIIPILVITALVIWVDDKRL